MNQPGQSQQINSSAPHQYNDETVNFSTS